MPNPQKIIDTTNAFYDSCVLFTASDLGIFKALSKHPGLDATALCEKIGLDDRGGRLLLDGCVAIGLLDKNGNNYKNTPDAEMFLVPGAPGDLSKAIRYNRDVYEAWGKLPQLIKTGKPVERPEIHLGDDSNRTRTFVLSMHSRALGIGRAVVPTLDYSNSKNLLDVGGGPGTYSVLIAKANPQIKSIVLDLPEVVKIAAELIDEQGMSERVKTLPGSYHDTDFPCEMDAVNFFGMLHQESPEDIIKLFKKAYESLKPGGVVYVMDMMTDASRAAPKFSALFALNMALTTQNGWVFSTEDLEKWLKEAGFGNFSVNELPAPMPHWLARAEKI